MKKLLLVLSLMLVSLSGCYLEGYDEGHRRGSGRHEDGDHQRGHDDGRSNRGDEHRDR